MRDPDVRSRAGGAKSALLAASLSAAGLLFATALAAEPSLENDPDVAAAASLQRAFAKVSKVVGPSVVRIAARMRRGRLSADTRSFHENMQPYSPENASEGSGVIVGADGVILTNEHVVRAAEKITVELADRRQYEGQVVGSDTRSDLAVIHIPATGLPAIPFGDSEKVQVGQWVLAVGNPFGLSNTVTVGVVSAKERSFFRGSGDTYYGNLIQTDAAINRGNSGGALVDLHGRLVGINTVIFSSTGWSAGVGFAIPANTVVERLPLLREGREIQYGWLGVEPRDVTQELARAFNVNPGEGVFVGRVVADSPAERAGLKRGSIILRLNGTELRSYHDLLRLVERCPVGKLAELDMIEPDGKKDRLRVKLGRRMAESLEKGRLRGYDPDDPDADGEKEPVPKPEEFRGMSLRDLTIEEAKRLRVASGLLVTGVRSNSPAQRAGLFEGAVVDEVKHADLPAPVRPADAKQFIKAVRDAKGPVLVHTTLDGYVTLDAETK